MVLFGDILQTYLDKRDMSHRAFAKATGQAHALISFIITGERSCPLEKLEEWMDLLEIPSEERASFKEAAVLTHANKELREYIDGLHKTIQKLKVDLGKK